MNKQEFDLNQIKFVGWMLSLLLVVVGGLYIIKPLVEDTLDVRDRTEQTLARNERLQARVDDLVEKSKNIDEQEKKVIALTAGFPQSGDQERTISTIYKLANASGLSVRGIEYSPPTSKLLQVDFVNLKSRDKLGAKLQATQLTPAKSPLVVVPMKIIVQDESGTGVAVSSFLRDLQSAERAIMVDKVNSGLDETKVISSIEVRSFIGKPVPKPDVEVIADK